MSRARKYDYERVADTYEWAIDNHLPPLVAVGEAFGISKKQAERVVHSVRRNGLLPPADSPQVGIWPRPATEAADALGMDVREMFRLLAAAGIKEVRFRVQP